MSCEKDAAHSKTQRTKPNKGNPMPKDKKSNPPKQPPHPPVKPNHPNTEGAPDDRDPNAQYEDKDES